MNNRLRISNSEPQATINDIASELGVSKTTVSRALSGKGRIGAKTRDRVLSYISERGYSPNLIAKSLAVSKTFNIAVALPKDTELHEIPFFQTCLHAITETAARREYDVVLSVITEEDISSVRRIVRNRKVDGIILTRPLADDAAISYLEETSLPFAVIGSPESDTAVRIDSDHRSGCRDATRHVLDRGFRRHVLLGGDPEHRVNQDRLAGYLEALRERNLSCAEGAEALAGGQERCVVWRLSGTRETEAAMPSIMAANPRCLVCMDDVIAGHALAWLFRRGVSIPRDLAMVSFHDSAALASHNPPVSALHVHVSELASLAGNTLIDMIEGKAVRRVNVVPSEFVIRDSSRAPPRAEE